MTSRLLDRDMMPNMMNPNMADVNKMGQTMYSNLMGHRGMTSTIIENEMPSIRMGQDMSTSMMERNMMGQDLYSNAMDNNNKMMASNILMGGNMNQMTPLSRMSQRMQIETMPSQSLNRFF